MDAVQIMLNAVAADPADEAAWLALADSLEDAGRFAEAEVARLREWLRHAAIDDPQRASNERRMQQLLADGVKPISPVMKLPLPGGLEMAFRLIPPGAFWMGSPADEPGRMEDEPLPHRVVIERGFWMGTYPVTQRQRRALLEPHPFSGSGGEVPETRLSWQGCDRSSDRLASRSRRVVSLPSEEQWEYACRAATTSPCYGGGLESIPLIAWCSYGEGPTQPKPVGEYAPNAWGLHDMLGNVWEWTTETVMPTDDPDVDHVIRGGSFRSLPARCRSASRAIVSGRESDDIGFRFVIDLE